MNMPDLSSGRISDRLRAAFCQAFDATPTYIARAPGRVNLIGEHTDYNDGFALPVAIGRETLVAVRARNDREIHVVATDISTNGSGALSRFSLTPPILHDAQSPWANYVRGMVLALQTWLERSGESLPGANIAIAGTIPQGSGLSSSASLSVATGIALMALARDAGVTTEVDATLIALLAQTSECDFIGVQCGIMDPLASARGVAGHALLIDCRSLACEAVAMPDNAALLIVPSGVARGLVDGHYNARHADCMGAARALGVPALRDASLAMLQASRLDAQAMARARHVITENARTLDAAAALRAGDLATLGALMRASHVSMRDDFAITLPAVDALAEELNALIRAHAGGLGGARMTGGGFGGAVVAVLPRERVAAVRAALTYRTPLGEAPAMMVETACAGASVGLA